jgi:hypothetical protein
MVLSSILVSVVVPLKHQVAKSNSQNTTIGFGRFCSPAIGPSFVTCFTTNTGIQVRKKEPPLLLLNYLLKHGMNR